jgi:hypothetical protein
VAALIVAAVVAVLLVATLTIDLGPALRRQAEQAGSRQIERPLRIGRLSIRLLTGQFVVEDLVIEGLTPKDRPFLTAKRIFVSLDWSTLFRREVTISAVDMRDWRMVVETFPNGRHSFPRFTRNQPRTGPRRFVTTVRHVRAWNGEFTFEDHVTPWSTVARNLEVVVEKTTEYRGRAQFSNGTVRIQSYEPMWATMRSTFTIEDGKVKLDRIDLETDGATSLLSGEVDLGRWPEQTYQVASTIQFPRMRELFFARERFSLFGVGAFEGTFHLYKGGRRLEGRFSSPLAGVEAFRFPNLEGTVLWLPDRLVVSDASAEVFGGEAQFSYSMMPFGKPTPAVARFEADYSDVDLRRFSDFLETRGMRLSGRASGYNLLEWPLGRWAEHRGEGHVEVTPPAGSFVLPRQVPEELRRQEAQRGPEYGPFDRSTDLGYVPVGGSITYSIDPEWVYIGPSRVATSRTYVEFEGRTAYGQRSRIPFHVTSADWQESDRLLAAVLTAFGSPTGPVPISGEGEFDGVMLNAFSRPRIEGRFTGQRLRAWDVTWGQGSASIVIENGYVRVTGGALARDEGEIHASGLYSLGYPRRDGGEELDARIRLVRWSVGDLRQAFDLQDYPVDGLLSGEFHLYGRYQAPFGFGRMSIDEAVAYGEPLDGATANLRFEGSGIRLDGIDIAKGSGGITGAALVGWDGTYSFNADGARVPLERIAALSYPRAPLSGLLQFSASGSGSFEEPRYDVRARIDDLFIADEGVGVVTGRVNVRGELLTLELEAASPRLAISGSGRVALTPEADTELTFRFSNTSLDPYIRTFQPRLSPFTTAVASGSIRVMGELASLEHLKAQGTVDQLDLSLFDYPVKNDGPIRLGLEQQAIHIERLRLVGDGTELDLTGRVGTTDRRITLRATGDANLGLLQGLFRDIRSSGAAELVAELDGTIDAPVFSGRAMLTNGRLRHFSLPHSLDAVNGRLSFDADGVRVDDATARMGGGDVRLGGRIGLVGFDIGQLNLTAVGERMQLRYPEGFRSIVDADLALRGDFYQPLLTGTVTVRDAVWTRRFDPELFDIGGGGSSLPTAAVETAIPIRFDVRIVAPSTLRIENNAARIVSSAELTLRGTVDHPVLFGRAEIQRGEVIFEGNRYIVTRGSIDFANPAKIEPFFDIEAETRVRAPGQIYRVLFQVAGTADRFVPELSSDPPLPTVDILALLFGEARDLRSAELRSLRSPEQAELEVIRAQAARLLASPISSEVGRVVEQTLGVDTVQITPSLGDLTSQQSARLSPSARLTIGKRISDRVYLTFSRNLSTSTRDQIILLEYDQNDRISWIVSQNEDRTYALDFRVRHTF